MHPREQQLLDVLTEINSSSKNKDTSSAKDLTEESQVYSFIDTLDEEKLRSLKKQIDMLLERKEFKRKSDSEQAQQNSVWSLNIDDIV